VPTDQLSGLTTAAVRIDSSFSDRLTVTAAADAAAAAAAAAAAGIQKE
jgi:hypothetical protein